MKPKFDVVLDIALEEGIRLGYSRAYKHDENPSESMIVQSIINYVKETLYEYFDFDNA